MTQPNPQSKTPEPNQDESLVAAIEGNFEGMAKSDLILTIKMLTNGRKIWMDEANAMKTQRDEARALLHEKNITANTFMNQVKKLQAEIEALKKDKEMLDWLESVRQGKIVPPEEYPGDVPLRTAITAAQGKSNE